MTLKELYSLYYIEHEIKEYELKILELKEMATNITQNYSGMSNGSNTTNKTEIVVASIVDYTTMLEKAIQTRIEQSIKINAFILEVEDAQLRLIMYLRFIQRMSWVAIAHRIGGGNTEDSVRKRCNRYVRKSEKLSVLSAS